MTHAHAYRMTRGLSAADAQRLNILAEENGRTRSAYVASVLRRHLADPRRESFRRWIKQDVPSLTPAQRATMETRLAVVKAWQEQRREAKRSHRSIEAATSLFLMTAPKRFGLKKLSRGSLYGWLLRHHAYGPRGLIDQRGFRVASALVVAPVERLSKAC